MINRILKFLSIAFFIALFLFQGNFVQAADFRTDYQVEYDLSNFKENLTSKVRFTIKITNLKGDVYVNKFTIGFPKSFAISNLSASDDHGSITPKVISASDSNNVEMEFSNPNVGSNSINNFYLNLDQTNLFKSNGNVWEVALPVIESNDIESYRVIVTLPSDTDKKISISKPKPTVITGNRIIWDNPKIKTIYAVFGASQIYKTELSYHLKNSEVFPIITEITFPPDTLYQKIFLESINPPPTTVYQDSDGNFLGKYYLKPLESKTIIFKGLIQVFPTAREEMIPVIRSQISEQKNYLLSQQKFWEIKNIEKISNLKSVQDIYKFDVDYLKYNYKKITSDNTRLGADTVLSRPDQAVCLEFTDLFIAAAREKGILSREIEGYGFSYDPQLQPLSLVSDVLHAWPEYFDPELQLWIPIDPTWENTSGIDYLTSFDLNHIVFSIHGKKSDYPLPAGMYKVGDSKDITITAATELPVDQKQVAIEDLNIPIKVSDNKDYQGKFSVKNTGNVYLLNVPVEVKGDGFQIEGSKSKILTLAPFEKKEIDFSLKSLSLNKQNKPSVSIYVFDQKLLEKEVTVVPYMVILGIQIAGGMVVFICIFLIVKKIRKKFHDR